MLQNVESRMQLAEQEGTDDLPGRWDILARQAAAISIRLSTEVHGQGIEHPVLLCLKAMY